MRQKARPYTFSNTLPPFIAAASLAAIELLEKDNSIVQTLHENTNYFRKEIVKLGFRILPGVHPIVPVMVGEAPVAMDMSEELLKLGVYVRGSGTRWCQKAKQDCACKFQQHTPAKIWTAPLPHLPKQQEAGSNRRLSTQSTVRIQRHQACRSICAAASPLMSCWPNYYDLRLEQLALDASDIDTPHAGGTEKRDRPGPLVQGPSRQLS